MVTSSARTRNKKGFEGVDFDDGRREIAPGDCRGLFCLQIAPKFYRESIVPIANDIDYGVHGIVLEPVGPEGRFQNDEKVYRRVGVYWIKHPQYYRTTEELSGTVERIKII